MRASSEGKFLTSCKREPAFISKGFIYWKEATTAFKKHQSSDCHKEATEALVILPQQIKGDIGEVLSNKHREEKALNRKMFLIILQNLSFLARQGLPLRGHEDVSSLRSLDNNEIIEWLTNKYTSHQIQNECLQIMALNIVREISKNIRNGACYTLMADECTDISNQEQFTICMRWVDNDLADHEDFIGLYQVSNINASTLTATIKDTILRMGLSLSQCRGQCMVPRT